MKYLAIPIWHKNAFIVEEVIREKVAELQKSYHDLPQEEKSRVGHKIHTLNGYLSGFKQPQYVREWTEFEKVFYPNKK